MIRFNWLACAAFVAAFSLNTFAASPEPVRPATTITAPRVGVGVGVGVNVDPFTPSAKFIEAEGKALNYAQQIDAEVAARAIPMPAEMAMDLDWYSPHLNAADGKVIKGWVRDDIILLETSSNKLICMRRADGVQRWICELDGPVRYAPAVSKINVLVNVNNHLIGVQKEGGNVRWKLLPNFVMSCAPLIIDPAAYPKEYSKNWQAMESIYVGGWNGRFHHLHVRGRMTTFIKNIKNRDDFSAPDFELAYPWHKTHKERGIITMGITLKDNIMYYGADDNNINAISRDGVERDPYYLMGAPTTPVTVTIPQASNTTNSTLNSVYVGGRDYYVYCLDRLTLKKKWNFAPGFAAVNRIYADQPETPFAYVATSDGNLTALKLTPAYTPKGQPEVPESFEPAWQTKAVGTITASMDTVYVGLEKDGEEPAFKGIAAIDKASGKTLWKSPSGFFSNFLEFHNEWNLPTQNARVYAITTDNRLVSLKEKVRKTGLRVIKPIVAPEDPKFQPKKDPKDPAGADKAAEEKPAVPKEPAPEK